MEFPFSMIREAAGAIGLPARARDLIVRAASISRSHLVADLAGSRVRVSRKRRDRRSRASARDIFTFLLILVDKPRG